MSKIKFAHIAPTTHILQAASESQVHMALQHLTLAERNIDNIEYIQTFKSIASQGGYIYLDNSEFELGYSCNLDELISAGLLINASCLILPDGNMNKADCKRIRDEGFDVMVIPTPNKNGLGLNTNFIEALHRPDINYVGLSYSKTSAALNRHRHSATSRFDFLAGLGTVLPNKKIHMLGAVVPGEIALMKPFEDAIMSWDTSLAVWAGVNYIDVKRLTHKNHKSVDFTSQKPWNSVCDSNIAYINVLLNS